MPTLDWLHRDAAFRIADDVHYRLLEPVSRHGDGSAHNLLVQGDNLQALKALLPLYRAQVKCIFIDPPYNTKSAFEHYDDNLEHSQWLSMMLPRLQLLREFLRDDGSIWVTIDDNEGHYLKVLMDEVFGRGNFIATIAWEKDKGGRGDADISTSQDMVLAYSLKRKRWAETRNLLDRTETQLGRFQNPDNDPRGPWRQGDDGTAKSGTEKQRFPIMLPSGRAAVPKPGRYWAFSAETFEQAKSEGRVYFGKNGDRLPIIKRYADKVREGVAPRTWWPAEEAGTNQGAKRDHLSKLLPDLDTFATPKPEQLLQRILHISSNRDDLVLDSFLGSGTTAAVAHKMGRRWIGIEMGEHALTHCLPRLEKVVAGEQGGISVAVGWQGGGGFCTLRLGEPVFDAEGRIHPQVRFAALAAFVWQQETRRAYTAPDQGSAPGAVPGTPLIGVHEGTAIYLLYNGILGDRRPDGGNVLTLAVLQALKAIAAPGTTHAATPISARVVYGEACRLGALLLARDLQRFGTLARKALRVVFYRGADAAAPSDELPLGERGYVLVLDEAVRALMLRLPADEVVQGAQRQRREHFPELALRELVVNALVHQDFAVRGAGPLVEAFMGQVDVTNPGRPLVAVERLIDWPAQSRNEALARAMRMLRFCEERGSGIDRVVSGAETLFLPAPMFEVLAAPAGGADFMRVRLFGPRPFARMSQEDRLRAVYQHACLLYQRGERLTNASLRQRLGLAGNQVAQVSRLIAQARERALIRPADDGERAYVPDWVGRALARSPS